MKLTKISKQEALELEDQQVLIHNTATNRWYTEVVDTRFIARSEESLPILEYYKIPKPVNIKRYRITRPEDRYYNGRSSAGWKKLQQYENLEEQYEITLDDIKKIVKEWSNDRI